jgi:hypothetical protein
VIVPDREHIDKYLMEFTLTERVRVYIKSEASRLTHFAVTLEHELAPGDWRPVARYDTTGGTVHRDRLKPDGSYLAHRERVRLGADLDAALVYAREELITHAERYVSDYLALLKDSPYDKDR